MRPPAHTTESATRPPPSSQILDASHALASIDGRAGDLTVEPVAGYHNELLLSLSPPIDDQSTPERFEVWDPRTNTRQPAWTGEAGAQDIVTGSDGDWVATVRTGYSLPFAAWTLILRNLATGEARTLAGGDASLAGEAGLHPDVPTGFAPLPAIRDGHVAWDEYVRMDGGVAKRVQLYDLTTGSTRTLAEVPDATKEDLRFPALGATTLALTHRSWSGGAESSSIDVIDLTTGAATPLSGSTGAWSAAVLNDGRLAWDDVQARRFVASAEGGAPASYASGVGWGTFTNGEDISWTPGADRAGYYDSSHAAMHMVHLSPGAESNTAGVYGSWFAWQELTPDGVSRFYVVPLSV